MFINFLLFFIKINKYVVFYTKCVIPHTKSNWCVIRDTPNVSHRNLNWYEIYCDSIAQPEHVFYFSLADLIHYIFLQHIFSLAD